MDPASIIGTTSAILSFVQFSAKVISTAIEIRDNAGQATKSNQELGATVKEFDTRLASLRSQLPVLHMDLSRLSGAEDDAQMSLLRCSAKCENLGSQIAALLNKIGQQNADHTRQPARRLKFWKTSPSAALSNDPSNVQAKAGYSAALKASFKSLWLEKEVNALREQWEQCVADFNLNFMRLDTQTRFQALQQVSEGNSTILNALQSDLQTLSKGCKDANLKALGSFLNDYQTQNSMASKEKRNSEYILKLLQFPGMDARRDQIHDAANDTFEWLLKEDSISDGHDDLKTCLKDWLATGAGVYHITGKPGSGKSTLMKLVGESYKSHEYLQQWARRDQKQLITVSFFTWKAAESNRLQNKVEGMIRTLLHQILTLEPGLISRVFPEHWQPQMYHVNSIMKETTLHWREIYKASERIFDSPVFTTNFRVFLLIDGMDEFDDPEEPHFRIAKRVKEWCERNPESVKACVSSREDSPFMDAFSAHQRLRLHLVTSGDIRRLTDQRLNEHPHFASSLFTDEQRTKLITSVTDRAEGVFLWVVLTIIELTYRLDARQGFDAIQEVIRYSNQNLNKFIKEILSRIPDTYTKDAQHLFRIVQFTTRTSFTLDLYHVHRAVTFAKAPVNLTGCANHTVSYEEAVAEVEEFKSRIPIMSRGLLELREFDSYETCVLAGPRARSSLSFIHRSVFDFFEENTDGIWNEYLVDNAPEELSLIIRSSAHIAHALTWQQLPFRDEPWAHRPARHWRHFVLVITELLQRRMVDNTMVESYFLPLKDLEAALLRKQGILSGDVQLDSSQWSDVHLPAQRFYVDTASVFLAACTEPSFKRSGGFEFVSWALKGGYPDWFRHPVYKARIAQACFIPPDSSRDSTSLSPAHINPVFLGLNEVLEADILPESIGFSSNLRGSLWLNYLVYIIDLMARYQLGSGPRIPKMSEANGDDIAFDLSLLLSFGVEPYILFQWWPKCVGTQRRGCVHPREVANSTSVAPSVYPSPAGAENSADDNTSRWEDGIRSIPSDADFSLEITVGTAPARQLSQGPRWPRMQDTLLMRFFLFNFGNPTGTATQVDVLKLISSLLRESGPRPRVENPIYIEHLNLAIEVLSQAMAQGTSPDFSEISVDCRPQEAPGNFVSVDTTAQGLAGSGPDQAKQLPMLTLETLLREYMVIILPILGKP